ncbi:hypothetical protein QBC37DRAFT_411876 [Rhypophila decipiens]|uniref:FAR1 domain-containing protein n=1 Tax=Rhypophila decipiens TaxID=261697 RepID=A0AAN7BAC5_9PEZI|nr:hypothetical protein QBC37DRAFT_411876 [Rhypophila decipiens]
MSTTNANAGLPFGGVGIRHGRFPPQPHTHTHNTANKPSPSLSQHASPYQPQPYAPQQQPTQAQYPHHLFSTPTPPQISSVATVQNAARPQQSQMPPVLPGPRQRAPPPRQMQQQPAHPSYLQQSLNQPMPQPMNPQQLSQQALSQPSLTQQQPLSQPSLHQHSLSQHLPQPMNQTSMSQSLSQQSVSQTVQNDNSTILSQQTTPHAPAQPTLPPAQPQLSQVQQPPQVQKVQQVQQIQQQPTPPQPEPVEPAHDANQDEDMEGGSQDESGEGDLSMDPKVVDGTPFVPRRPMGPMMSAPPEGGSFPTLEAVHKYALSYCTSVGYAIVIGRSKKTVPGLKKVLFVCDRAGKPPRRVTPENRKRKTTSRKCDCQFGFFAIEQRTQWVVRYRPDSMHLQHNHGPSESPLLHPAARKLDSKMISTVKSLKESGMFFTFGLDYSNKTNSISRSRGKSNSRGLAARESSCAASAPGYIQCEGSHKPKPNQDSHWLGRKSARHIQQAPSVCRGAYPCGPQERVGANSRRAQEAKGGEQEGDCGPQETDQRQGQRHPEIRTVYRHLQSASHGEFDEQQRRRDSKPYHLRLGKMVNVEGGFPFGSVKHKHIGCIVIAWDIGLGEGHRVWDDLYG